MAGNGRLESSGASWDSLHSAASLKVEKQSFGAFQIPLYPKLFLPALLQKLVGEFSKGCGFFCLQLEASCLQWSFFTYS